MLQTSDVAGDGKVSDTKCHDISRCFLGTREGTISIESQFGFILSRHFRLTYKIIIILPRVLLELTILYFSLLKVLINYRRKLYITFLLIPFINFHLFPLHFTRTHTFKMMIHAYYSVVYFIKSHNPIGRVAMHQLNINLVHEISVFCFQS